MDNSGEQYIPVISNHASRTFDMVLSDELYRWMMWNVKPIVAKDFSGWMFKTDVDSRVWCVVSLTGEFSLYNRETKFDQAPRYMRRVWKRWMRVGNIRRAKNDPFQEWQIYNNLKMDCLWAKISADTLFVEEDKLPLDDPCRKVYNAVLGLKTAVARDIINTLMETNHITPEEVQDEEEEQQEGEEGTK